MSLIEIFCQWSSLPFVARKKMGVPTQKDFAKKYKVNSQTLTAWKHRDDFEIKREKHMKSWTRELTPNVLKAMYDKAVRMDGWDHPKYIELWLQYVEGWNPRAKPEPKKPVFNLMALNEIISLLPEEEQKEFYITLNRLLDRAEEIYEQRYGEKIPDIDNMTDEEIEILLKNKEAVIG